MIEKISICAVNESGETITLDESIIKISSGLDVVIADVFSEIVRTQQNIDDEEIRASEKFYFAQTLSIYLKEMKENASNNRTNQCA